MGSSHCGQSPRALGSSHCGQRPSLGSSHCGQSSRTDSCHAPRPPLYSLCNAVNLGSSWLGNLLSDWKTEANFNKQSEGLAKKEKADMHQRSAWRAEAHASLGGMSLHRRCCFLDWRAKDLYSLRLWQRAHVKAEHMLQQQSQCPCQCPRVLFNTAHRSVLDSSSEAQIAQKSIVLFTAVHPQQLHLMIADCIDLQYKYRGGNRNTHVSLYSTAQIHTSLHPSTLIRCERLGENDIHWLELTKFFLHAQCCWPHYWLANAALE